MSRGFRPARGEPNRERQQKELRARARGEGEKGALRMKTIKPCLPSYLWPILVLTIGCTPPDHPEPADMNQTANRNHTVESALGFLPQLIDHEVLYRELIETVLGVKLHLDTTHPRDSFIPYLYERGTPASSTDLIKEVDLRAPVTGRMKHGFLFIDLEPTRGLNMPAIVEYYGWPNLRVEFPRPGERNMGVDVYFIYLLGKWEVTFTFGPPPREALRSLSLRWPGSL
ncbi:MAG: hypothetical protein LGR52_12350 [Candidatus Thiosymbion ectosymbiont of Robbea hypermnestra]|nr:hypothetical protein [Candidatus Thiosymbion ectosymbiont of Robbea hypermnestra]